jgi:tripartite-type tricarboxylate transporter receptor subunit TctC
MLLRAIAFAALTAGSIFISSAASADTYPSKSIRLVVPWTAGSGGDIAGRMVAQKLTELLGQTVYVDNRAGATGTIGTAAVGRDAADGYTLLLGNSATHGAAKTAFPKLPYDPINDFTPISMMYKNRLVVAVHKDFPANTLAELVNYAKANPGKVSYGTPGEATPHLLAGETLKSKAGINLIHVPYKGGGQVMNDLVAGHIQVAVSAVSVAVDMNRTGRVKILAITDQQRIDSLPGVPTLSESYPGIDIAGWAGLFGPKQLPAPIVNKLNQAMRIVLASPELKNTFEAAGMTPGASTPEELRGAVNHEMQRWHDLMQGRTKAAN